MSEQAAKKPRTKQTGPRVFIVTIGGEQFHITANDFRVAAVADNVGLLSGEIKPLRGTGFIQHNP